jgi:hypothetical protein
MLIQKGLGLDGILQDFLQEAEVEVAETFTPIHPRLDVQGAGNALLLEALEHDLDQAGFFL